VSHTQTSAPSLGGDGPRRWSQLWVVFGPTRALPPVLTLDDRPVVVGREPSREPALQLDDGEVSCEHVEMVREGEGWIAVDRGSRNGTHVDGQRVERAPLRHGTVLRIGRTLIVHSEATVRHGEPLRRESPNLRGASVAMQRLRGEIALLGPSSSPALIRGETGSGKERAAREIHERSGRKGTFVAVNCAAIHAGVAESELFGHVAGAFTGATQRADGLFVAADGGTLLLDEVGELPPALQPKLLRALALGEIRPVGRTEPRSVDVRVLAATHHDLEAALAAGTFREDLYARLAGWTLTVPPLRARREDVLGLAQVFLEEAEPGLRLSSGAAEALVLHSWPFNVRELEQTIRTAAVRSKRAGMLSSEHLPEAIAAPVRSRRPALPGSGRPPDGRPPSDEELRRTLARFQGNVQQVAAHFDKDRRQIYRWIEQHGIDVEAYRRDAGEPE
jgi:transcriptional regulator with GAF, ATPase, and Fis domain